MNIVYMDTQRRTCWESFLTDTAKMYGALYVDFCMLSYNWFVFHIYIAVWAAGGQLRPGVRSVLRDEAPDLRGRGEWCHVKCVHPHDDVLISGDDKHNPAAEPELPGDLQRGGHLCLPGQEAVRQHLSDQVSDILHMNRFYMIGLYFHLSIHYQTYGISKG